MMNEEDDVDRRLNKKMMDEVDDEGRR